MAVESVQAWKFLKNPCSCRSRACTGLATFARAVDASGNLIEVPWYDFTGVAISTPRKFRFAVEERREGSLRMMEEAAKAEHADEMASAGGHNI